MVDTERLKGRCTYLYTYLPTYVLLDDIYYGMCNVPLCYPFVSCAYPMQLSLFVHVLFEVQLRHTFRMYISQCIHF